MSGKQKPIGTITLPVYKLPEDAYVGLRQNMLTIGPHGVCSAAGLGGDGIYAELDTKGKKTYHWVLGRDVLIAVAGLVGHPETGAIREAAHPSPPTAVPS